MEDKELLIELRKAIDEADGYKSCMDGSHEMCMCLNVDPLLTEAISRGLVKDLDEARAIELPRRKSREETAYDMCRALWTNN